MYARAHKHPHVHTQLVLAGVVDEGVGLSLLNDMLTAVMKIDGKGHPYLAVVVSFARHCVEDLAGIAPRKQRLLLTKYKIRPPKSEVSHLNTSMLPNGNALYLIFLSLAHPSCQASRVS